MRTHPIIVVLALASFGCEVGSASEESPPGTPRPDSGAKPSTDTAQPRLPPPQVQGTTAFDEAMTPILNSYLTIQQALAADTMEGVSGAAEAIAAAAENVDGSSIRGKHAQIYQDMPANIRIHATNIASSEDIKSARGHFNGLSKAMSAWTAGARPPGIDMVYCSMAPGGWFQRKGPLRNPYYGAKMLECGDIVNAGPTARLDEPPSDP